MHNIFIKCLFPEAYTLYMMKTVYVLLLLKPKINEMNKFYYLFRFTSTHNYEFWTYDIYADSVMLTQ